MKIHLKLIGIYIFVLLLTGCSNSPVENIQDKRWYSEHENAFFLLSQNAFYVCKGKSLFHGSNWKNAGNYEIVSGDEVHIISNAGINIIENITYHVDGPIQQFKYSTKGREFVYVSSQSKECQLPKQDF